MRNTACFLALFVLIQIGCSKRDQVDFDRGQQFDSLNSIYWYFDLKRDSLMEFEVFDELTGDMVGTEYWWYARDIIVFDKKYAHYVIERNFKFDRSVNSIDLDVGLGAIWLHYGTYRYPFMSVPNVRDTSVNDTLFKYAIGKPFLYRRHYPLEKHLYNDKYYMTAHCGRDSFPYGGTVGFWERKAEDYYFGKGIGLYKMTEVRRETTSFVYEKEVYRLVKWRVK